MADRIAVMTDGKVLQVGSPDEIYERPSNRFVADFIGETNFLQGVLEHSDGTRGRLLLADGSRLEAVLGDPGLTPGVAACLAVRPEKLSVQAADAGTAPAAVGANATDEGSNSLVGTVTESHYLGTDTRYAVRVGDEITLVARIQNQHSGFESVLPVGTRVRLRWPRDRATILR